MPGTLPLQRVQVEQNQRVDAIDWNDTARLGLENLFLTFLHGFGHSGGWLTSGTLTPTSGMNLQLDPPLCAISQQGLIVMNGSHVFSVTSGLADGSTSGQSRLDVLSVGFLESDGGSALRRKINPVTGVQSDAPVNTRKVWSPVFHVAQGVPAANPVRNASGIPAGNIPLYEIRVANGQTSLSGGDISIIPSYCQQYNGLLTSFFTGDGVGHSIPYTTPPIGSVEVPNGMAAVVDIDVTVRILPQISPPPPLAEVPDPRVRHMSAVICEILNLTTNTVIGGTEFTPLFDYGTNASLGGGITNIVFSNIRVRGIMFPTSFARHSLALRFRNSSISSIHADQLFIPDTLATGGPALFAMIVHTTRIVP